MVRLASSVLLGGASAACGFAAIGVALYAGSPAQAAAVTLFAGIGFGAGVLCGCLHAVFDGLPKRATTPDAPAGDAADLHPSPAEVAATALAGAASSSLAAARLGPGVGAAETQAQPVAIGDPVSSRA